MLTHIPKWNYKDSGAWGSNSLRSTGNHWRPRTGRLSLAFLWAWGQRDSRAVEDENHDIMAIFVWVGYLYSTLDLGLLIALNPRVSNVSQDCLMMLNLVPRCSDTQDRVGTREVGWYEERNGTTYSVGKLRRWWLKRIWWEWWCVRYEEAVSREGYRYRGPEAADEIRVLAVDHLTLCWASKRREHTDPVIPDEKLS